MVKKSDYNFIDFRLNIIYDTIYDDKSCTTYQPLYRKNIKLIDIKEPVDFDYDNIFDENKFEYMGYVNNRWHFKRISSKSFSSTLSVGCYGSGNINNLERKELYNAAMHLMMSELVCVDKISNILLPVMYFDITPENLKKSNKMIYDKISKSEDKSSKSEDKSITSDSRLYVMITEQYTEIMFLPDFLKKESNNIIMWKCLFFQVLYALHKISEKFQKFRHNKLDLDAIRICIKKKSESKYYNVKGVGFKLPEINFEIKITDFDYSYTSDYIKNIDTKLTEENPYYDIHYFFSSIYIFLIAEYGKIPDNLSKIINDIIIKKYLPVSDKKFTGLHEKDFNINSQNIILPSFIILKNNFFSEFITNNMDASPVQNKSISREKMTKKEPNTSYLSPTESVGDKFRMLAKKINKKKIKKSKEYNKSMKKTIKGSRKNITSNNTKIGSGKLFSKAEKYKKPKRELELSSSDKSDNSKSDNSKSDSSKSDSSKSDSSKSDSSSNNSLARSISSSDNRKKKSKKSKKLSGGLSSDSFSISEFHRKIKKGKSKSFDINKILGANNIMNKNQTTMSLGDLPPGMALPPPGMEEQYDANMGQNISGGYENMIPFQQQMPQHMMEQQMMEQQMMGQMMPQQMMPQQMMGQMMPQQMMGQMPQQMMGQPMMGGGNKKQIKKYCFIKDNKIVDASKEDFFF